MSNNTKSTTGKIASLASKVLLDNSSSDTAKSLAASALSQVNRQHQTGSQMEDLAAKVLHSDKYNNETKKLAGSILSQSNKSR